MRSRAPGRLPALAAALALVAPLAASLARAQEVDPIGALLEPDQASPPPADPIAASPETPLAAPEAPATPDESSDMEPDPDEASEPPAPAAPPMSAAAPPSEAGLPAGPQPYATLAPPPRRPRTELGAPVHIDELGRSPDGPPNARDIGYESRMRSSFAAAQGLQGPLDGTWTLVGDDGRELYGFELVDRSGRELEGAWRDPTRVGAFNGSGFLDGIVRDGGRLTLSFRPQANAPAAVATLQAGVDGRYSGEIVDRGERRRVTLRRN